MEIQKLLNVFARHPGVKALAAELQRSSDKTIQLTGIHGSCMPLVFGALTVRAPQVLGVPYVFVLDDEEEAGYFYHDLVQMLGETSDEERREGEPQALYQEGRFEARSKARSG